MAQQKADRREIVISINDSSSSAENKNGDTKEKKPLTAKDLWESTFRNSKIGNAIGTPQNVLESADKASVTLGAVGSYAAISTAKNIYSIVRAEIDYNVQRQFQLTDNYVMQREIDVIKGSIQKGLSFGGAIASGAVAGAKFGPIGVAIGATIGTAVAVIKHNQAVVHNRDQAQIQLAQATFSAAYSRSRMGFVLTDMGKNTYN
jgi:hypothetical protein